MKFLFLIPALFFIASCADQNSKETNADSSKNVPVLKKDSSNDWRSLTDSWSESLNLKNAPIMKSFYSDSVNYYGDRISGDDVVKRQQEYFSSNPDYKQKILEFVGEEQQPNGSWRVRIRKEVTAGGKVAEYPASLTFAKQNGIWKIITESDDITDLKKGQALTVHYAPEIVTVEGLMEENTGFGPSKEGDPKSDSKETYYVVWPSHPLDVLVPNSSEKGSNISEYGIDRLQLIVDVKKIAPLLNKKVRLTGTLSHSNTPHHFTKVLLEVSAIEEIK